MERNDPHRPVLVLVNGRLIEVPAGTILSAALPAGFVETPCGGRGSCGKCRVTARGALSGPSPEELELLTPQELAAGVRLACRARAEGACAVEGELPGRSRIQLDGELPGLRPDPGFKRYGAAVDLGTTTLAASLYDEKGRRLARAGGPNPQGAWGADVISRIGAAINGEGPALARAVREGIGGLLLELSGRAGIGPGEIDMAVITGNTAMLCLLTGTDPAGLARAPFRADRLFGEELSGGELQLPCARVYLPRCVSAFVGGDMTTALLYSGICGGPGTRMLVDIGTNGETALWLGGRLLCCSTAAGPAFEGAGLSMGMPGKEGAVDRVRVEAGRMAAHVLGGGAPKGICGSGVVDALACLLELGALEESGLLREDPAPVAPPVCLTQRDVRMVQLAKSAVAAGILALVSRAGITCREVEELAVAGGFGSSLDVKNAGRIGLLPGELAARARAIGNGALGGAAMLLLDKGLIPYSEGLAAGACTVDLTTDGCFLEAYTEGMLF